MSAPTTIDFDAPVISHQEVDIEAPLDTVWQLHVEVNVWPTWQTDITSAQLAGAFEPGASFDWTSYGFSVTSTIHEVIDRSRVVWGGTSGGITGVHEWRFAGTPTGVHVSTFESFAGDPVEADIDGMQEALDASLASWLGHLKMAAEALSEYEEE
jgi:uncharacterized membrane protein